MHKDFDTWNTQKKKLDETTRNLEFKEGEVWWCHFGINIAEEVYGKGEYFRRPAIIIKNFHTILVLCYRLQPKHVRAHGISNLPTKKKNVLQ